MQSTPSPVESLSSLSPHGSVGGASEVLPPGTGHWLKSRRPCDRSPFPEAEEPEGRKSRADGCLPASCSEQEYEREEAWSGRRPCSLPSDRPLSSFSLYPCLHPLKSSLQLQAVPTSPPAEALLCFFAFHDLSFLVVHWAFVFFFLLSFGMVWFKYIALIHVAFASEDLAVTLSRPRWHGILVDPPASVSTCMQGLGV